RVLLVYKMTGVPHQKQLARRDIGVELPRESRWRPAIFFAPDNQGWSTHLPDAVLELPNLLLAIGLNGPREAELSRDAHRQRIISYSLWCEDLAVRHGIAQQQTRRELSREGS